MPSLLQGALLMPTSPNTRWESVRTRPAQEENLAIGAHGPPEAYSAPQPGHHPALSIFSQASPSKDD